MDEKNGAWIHRRAASESAAREIEDSLHGKGYKGGGGGGDEYSVHVYAYEITLSTAE